MASEFAGAIVIGVYSVGVAIAFGITMGLDANGEPDPAIAFAWPLVAAILLVFGPLILIGWLAQLTTQKIKGCIK